MKFLDQARKIVADGPVAVADEIYGGKWGLKHLGNTEPGDGFAYLGRGFIQLTGRDNRQTTGSHLCLDIGNHPDEAAKSDNAARIAVDYWETAVVQKKSAARYLSWTSRVIDGGTDDLLAREAAASWERKLDAGYRPGQPDPTADHFAADRRQLQAGLNTLGYTDARGRRWRRTDRKVPA